MRGIAADGSVVYLGTLRHNLALGSAPKLLVAGADSAFNSWDPGRAAPEVDVRALMAAGWDAPRQPDGSLPAAPLSRLPAAAP